MHVVEINYEKLMDSLNNAQKLYPTKYGFTGGIMVAKEMIDRCIVSQTDNEEVQNEQKACSL